MKTLEVRFTSSPLEAPRLVGTLLDQGGRSFFEYAEAWLDTGLNLSPFGSTLGLHARQGGFP